MSCSCTHMREAFIAWALRCNLKPVRSVDVLSPVGAVALRTKKGRFTVEQAVAPGANAVHAIGFRYPLLMASEERARLFFRGAL